MLIKLAKILMENEVIEEDELNKFLDAEKEGKIDETNVN